MEHLQKEVFEQSGKVVGKYSILRVLMYTLISAVLVVLLIWMLSYPIDTYTIGFALIVSFAYSAIRDFFIGRYSRTMMYAYYDYLQEKKPGIELYIPIFQVTRQGTLLRKSALYVDKGQLYLEAFSQVKKKRPVDSISVQKGRDFAIDIITVDEQKNIVNINARLKEGDLKFSLINNAKVLEIIKK